MRHIVLSNRHVCVPLEVTFSFSDWIRREWLDQLNTNVHFEKLPSGENKEIYKRPNKVKCKFCNACAYRASVRANETNQNHFLGVFF